MDTPGVSDKTLSVVDEGAQSANTSSLLYLALEYRRPAAGSARYALDGYDEIRIGRGAERTARECKVDGVRRLQLTIPDRRASSEHLRLARIGNSWAIEDLGSKNGTLLNGTKLSHARIRSGDRIEIGETLFVFGECALATATAHQDSLDLPQSVSSTLLPSLRAQFSALERVLEANLPILIRGETGTGKELVAEWAHRRRGGPFVPVNCGALPEALAESELFGFRKGAFSGAREDRPGLIRSAHRGTLFLDEIADLKSASQAALLRVLQEKQVLPLGSNRAVDIDVRFVAATHQDLDEMVQSGAFRADLLARLAGHVFELPALRQRLGELGSIVASVVHRAAPERLETLAFTPTAARALAEHTWPLNIRELQHALASALAQTAADGIVGMAHLPKSVTEPRSAPPSRAPLSAEDAELRSRVANALRDHGGNISAAARALNTDRKQIRRWVRRLGIPIPRD